MRILEIKSHLPVLTLRSELIGVKRNMTVKMMVKMLRLPPIIQNMNIDIMTELACAFTIAHALFCMT